MAICGHKRNVMSWSFTQMTASQSKTDIGNCTNHNRLDFDGVEATAEWRMWTRTSHRHRRNPINFHYVFAKREQRNTNDERSTIWLTGILPIWTRYAPFIQSKMSHELQLLSDVCAFAPFGVVYYELPRLKFELLRACGCERERERETQKFIIW